MRAKEKKKNQNPKVFRTEGRRDIPHDGLSWAGLDYAVNTGLSYGGGGGDGSTGSRDFSFTGVCCTISHLGRSTIIKESLTGKKKTTCKKVRFHKELYVYQ
jgi:hypothetical protein